MDISYQELSGRHLVFRQAIDNVSHQCCRNISKRMLMSNLCCITSQTVRIGDSHSFICQSKKRNWCHTHHASITLARIIWLLTLVDGIERCQAGMARTTPLIQFRNTGNPTVLVLVVPFPDLRQIPFYICQTNGILWINFLTFGIQKTICSKECHLSII